ncbi:MAG TPA: hypothetical protein VGL93_14240 [Streptosporangiaceae bacterium]|jgi:hypothetical protein
MTGEAPLGPFGLDRSVCATRAVDRTVLVPVHHLTAGTRLAEVVPMLEADRRIQVVYTQAPTQRFGAGTAEYLRGLGAVVIPWRLAIASRFDLAVAATHGSLESLHAPVLYLPHGVGFARYQAALRSGEGPAGRRYSGDASPAAIVKYGRIVPSAIVVAHEAQLEQLAQGCPEAVPVARVAGDPAYDRLLASAAHRAEYRAALGVRQGRRLVVVSSSHQTSSLLGRHPDLLPRLMAALPADRYQVAAAVHPNVWAWHGRRQVTAWYADCIRAGMRLLPPEHGWHGALVAADVVLGDCGSVTYYAAAAGRPVALAAFPDESGIDPSSQMALLARIAPRLDSGLPLRPQIDAVMADYAPLRYAEIRARASSVPGRSAELIRSVMYELMDLPEPARPAHTEPAPAPVPIVPFPEAA